MKLTITNDNKEAGPDVVFVGITIFANIVELLNRLNCLPRDAEHRNGAVLPQQDLACTCDRVKFYPWENVVDEACPVHGNAKS